MLKQQPHWCSSQPTKEILRGVICVKSARHAIDMIDEDDDDDDDAESSVELEFVGNRIVLLLW